MVFLEKIGQNLSKAEFQVLKDVGLGSILQHHHLNHGDIAVGLPKTIHVGSGNTKFWHIFGKASKTLLKSLAIIGTFMSLEAMAKGDFAGSQGLPDPTLSIDEFYNSYIVNGLQTGNYNSVKSGLVGTKDKNWSYTYLSNEEMATYLETGVAPTGSYQNSGTPLFNSIDEVYKGTGRLLPYMKVSYQGKPFGAIELPQ